VDGETAMRRPWTRRAGAFWQAFVHAQARSQHAPTLPRRSSASLDEPPRARDRRPAEVVPQEKVAPIDDL
jgi:hypothetical protein